MINKDFKDSKFPPLANAQASLNNAERMFWQGADTKGLGEVFYFAYTLMFRIVSVKL